MLMHWELMNCPFREKQFPISFSSIKERAIVRGQLREALGAGAGFLCSHYPGGKKRLMKPKGETGIDLAD